MQMVLAAAGEGSPRAPMEGFIWLIVIMVLAFYFIIIRPQKREQQEKQKMVASVSKGDRVVTIGGIHGTVAGVDQTRNTVSVDVGKNVKIEFSRNAVSSVEKKGKKAGPENSK
ncbi:hypothetical protein AMJ85_00745 [candidate division BRC1 bacterium SM23_51]|nr:MAG: hypothetical protein AMJ85_00745 [candidate division BRC1 bacterium SM23_51]